MQWCEIETLICGLLNQSPEDYSEQVRAIAAAWSQLTEDAKRNVLPAILSKAVLQMSTGEMTLGLVDDAAEIVGEAAEQHTTYAEELPAPAAWRADIPGSVVAVVSQHPES